MPLLQPSRCPSLRLAHDDPSAAPRAQTLGRAGGVGRQLEMAGAAEQRADFIGRDLGV
jgi:hypothetical protein